LSLALWLILGIYTHFYGLVVAGALMLSLLSGLGGERGRVRTVLLIGGLVGCCALGVSPFASGAVSISGGAPEPGVVRDRWREVGQMLYRLVGHPALLVYPVAVGIGLLSAVTLLAAGLLVPRPCAPQARALQRGLAAGLLVTVAANFVLNDFAAAKYSYSSWALPPLFVLAGGALAVRGPWLRRAAGAAALALLACEVVGSSQLWVRGDYYAHTPHHRVRTLLDALPTGETAVVHDGETAAYPSLYFPIHYLQGPRLTQYVVAEAGRPVVGGNSLSLGSPGLAKTLSPYRRLVIVRSRHQQAADIARQIRDGDRALGMGPVVVELEASGEWARVRHELFVSFVASEVVVLARAGEGLADGRGLGR
jgi:hypothetical protein